MTRFVYIAFHVLNMVLQKQQCGMCALSLMKAFDVPLLESYEEFKFC